MSHYVYCTMMMTWMWSALKMVDEFLVFFSFSFATFSPFRLSNNLKAKHYVLNVVKMMLRIQTILCGSRCMLFGIRNNMKTWDKKRKCHEVDLASLVLSLKSLDVYYICFGRDYLIFSGEKKSKIISSCFQLITSTMMKQYFFSRFSCFMLCFSIFSFLSIEPKMLMVDVALEKVLNRFIKENHFCF